MTVRALSVQELADTAASLWFAIQLLCSPTQLEAEQVPNLDIFTEYRLYWVAEPEQERTVQVLRMGFFSSEVAAQAVAGYLAAYFPTPSIKRVSTAEHERFADRLVAASKDVGATGRHAVIEVAAAPEAAEAAEARAEASPAVSAKRWTRAATPVSIWSRLRGLRI